MSPIAHADAPTMRPASPPLRVARVARGLTQAQLAQRTALSRSTISRLEGGREQPLWPTVHRLAEALAWPPLALFPEDRP